MPGLFPDVFPLASRIREEGPSRYLYLLFFAAVAFIACAVVLNCCGWGELGLCMIMCVRMKSLSMITFKSSEHVDRSSQVGAYHTGID